MEAELLETMYNVMIRYVTAKDKQVAVEHMIADLIDAGADDEVLKHLSNTDRVLKGVIAEHIEVDEDIEEEDGY